MLRFPSVDKDGKELSAGQRKSRVAQEEHAVSVGARKSDRTPSQPRPFEQLAPCHEEGAHPGSNPADPPVPLSEVPGYPEGRCHCGAVPGHEGPQWDTGSDLQLKSTLQFDYFIDKVYYARNCKETLEANGRFYQ